MERFGHFRVDTGKLLKTPTKPCQCVAQFDPKVEVLFPLLDRVDTPKWTPCLAHENTWTLRPFPVFIGCNSLHFSLMDGIIVMAIVSNSGRRRGGTGNPLQNQSGFGSVWTSAPDQVSCLWLNNFHNNFPLKQTVNRQLDSEPLSLFWTVESDPAMSKVLFPLI